MAFRKLCVCNSLISTAKMSEKKERKLIAIFLIQTLKRNMMTRDLYLAQKEKRDKEITKVA